MELTVKQITSNYAMVEEMKDYIIKYSRDEENILKMAEKVQVFWYL